MVETEHSAQIHDTFLDVRVASNDAMCDADRTIVFWLSTGS